jgi:Holliday junction resolvase RusA-like endonuclease
MQILNIKPLSVNEAWKGRRFKTDKYKRYEFEVCAKLPRIKLPEGFLSVSLEFGFSNHASDIDNPVKLFIDCMQKKYGFNDRMIKELHVKAIDCKKGEEYIKFSIEEFNHD